MQYRSASFWLRSTSCRTDAFSCVVHAGHAGGRGGVLLHHGDGVHPGEGHADVGVVPHEAQRQLGGVHLQRASASTTDSRCGGDQAAAGDGSHDDHAHAGLRGVGDGGLVVAVQVVVLHQHPGKLAVSIRRMMFSTVSWLEKPRWRTRPSAWAWRAAARVEPGREMISLEDRPAQPVEQDEVE